MLRNVLLKSSVEKIEIEISMQIGINIIHNKTLERRCKLNVIVVIFIVVSLSLQMCALIHTNLTNEVYYCKDNIY